MTTLREAATLALEALDEAIWHIKNDNLPPKDGDDWSDVCDALRTALEQPEQEPVAWMLKTGHGTEFKEQLTDELKALTWKGKPMWTPLYTTPPQRKPLTDEEIEDLYFDGFSISKLKDFARAIEAAHGIREPI